MDTRTPAQRRHIMQSVGTKDTGPEWTVRRLLHGLGYRYRLHGKNLPGRPDIVFPARKKAIFVHGCFWHRHDCPKGRPPKSKADYWLPKLDANEKRDLRNLEELAADDWKTLVVWQCETNNLSALKENLVEFLETR